MWHKEDLLHLPYNLFYSSSYLSFYKYVLPLHSTSLKSLGSNHCLSVNFLQWGCLFPFTFASLLFNQRILGLCQLYILHSLGCSLSLFSLDYFVRKKWSNFFLMEHHGIGNCFWYCCAVFFLAWFILKEWIFTELLEVLSMRIIA